MFSYLIVLGICSNTKLREYEKICLRSANSYSNVSFIQTPSFNINEYSMMMTLANTGAFGLLSDG